MRLPGGAAIRSAISRCTITTARATAPPAGVDHRQHQRAGDLVGQVADDDQRPPGAACGRDKIESRRVRGPRTTRGSSANSAAEDPQHVGIALERDDPAGGGSTAASAAVSAPSPAPISTTTSSAPARPPRRCAQAPCDRRRKFWPQDFFAASPCRASTAADRRRPRQDGESGSPGSTARSRPARVPRKKSALPSAAIIAALSVQRRGGGMKSPKPSSRAASASARAAPGWPPPRRRPPAHRALRAPARAATCGPARRPRRPESWRTNRPARPPPERRPSPAGSRPPSSGPRS